MVVLYRIKETFSTTPQAPITEIKITTQPPLTSVGKNFLDFRDYALWLITTL